MASESNTHPSVQAVSKANQDFGSKLYPSLVSANGPEQNLIMSPFSVSSVLAMSLGGARGKTGEQMRTALCLANVEDQTVHEGYKQVLEVTKSSENFTLAAANRLFVQNNYQVLEDYLVLTKNHYEASPELVDFAKEDKSRKQINDWVEEQTRQKIKDLIAPGVLTPLTKMVLVNAVYFKGDWEEKFDKDATTKSPFQLASGDKVEVDMMHRKGKYAVAFEETLDCTVLDMPYKGKRLSMLFFLSNKKAGFETMENKLSTFDWSSLKFHKGREFIITLPRFKVETTHDLVKPLKDLGMVDMFDADKADLSGISGEKDLFVSHVVQKAFIEVNEEGSEAAAATAVVMMMRCAMREDRFDCNRPFLFAIRDNETGMILFNGRVMDPTKQ